MTQTAHWLAIAGPTASGKTALALAIAQRWPTEIISVDSALVYRGMDIGTAKPTRAELAAVPHHLIDIRDPLNAYNAAEFVKDTQTLVSQIQQRGKLPLLVGGTMLYFKALFDGLDDMPQAQPELRRAIESEAQSRGWPAMHAELAAQDPTTAARLAPNDSQRIGRALEVLRATGRPISDFHRKHKGGDTDTKPLQINGQTGQLLSLEPAHRAWLHERIAQRFDEVRHLRERADLHPDLPSMRCVGYRQAWEALDNNELSSLRDRGIFATRQLAKRQITWLRSMPQRQILVCDDANALEKGILWAQDALNGHT